MSFDNFSISGVVRFNPWCHQETEGTNGAHLTPGQRWPPSRGNVGGKRWQPPNCSHFTPFSSPGAASPKGCHSVNTMLKPVCTIAFSCPFCAFYHNVFWGERTKSRCSVSVLLRFAPGESLFSPFNRRGLKFISVTDPFSTFGGCWSLGDK